MRRTRTCIVASVLVLGAAAPSAAQAPAAAEPPAADKWQFVIAPYFMGASMSGTVGVAGQEMTVDVSATDIFKNIKFGLMGTFLARKGNWGAGFDGMWASLGVTTPTEPVYQVDADQGQFAFYGLRRLAAVADLTFGLRWNIVSNTLQPQDEAAAPTSDTKQWVDPLVGLNLHVVRKRLRAALYAEIGGFGVGSDIAWQICPTIGFQASRRFGLDFGWRWLSADYESGSGDTAFKWDVTQQGPLLGLAFTF